MDEMTFNGNYRAIVTDNNDPLQAGRVRVRVMPMFKDVDADALPWAVLADAFMGSPNAGSVNIPEIGANLFVFFEAGDHRYPVYFATAPSIQNGTPDLPTLTREADDSVTDINTNAKKGVGTASGSSWDEPGSAYAAVYPENKIWKTTDGLLIELDDTDGQLRFHIYHPAGTRMEIDKDGNEVNHTQGNRFTVVVGDDKVYITGNGDITVDGDMGIKVGGDTKIDVTGNADIIAAGDASVESVNSTVKGSASVTIDGGPAVTITGGLISLNP